MMNNHELIWNLVMAYEYVSVGGSPVQFTNPPKHLLFTFHPVLFLKWPLGPFNIFLRGLNTIEIVHMMSLAALIDALKTLTFF